MKPTADDSFAYWDWAVAYLSGWAQQEKHAKGFLLMEVSYYLCKDADECHGADGSSLLNNLLLHAFMNGKSNLVTGDCDGAKERARDVEKLVLTVLVDLVAYFAELIDSNMIDMDNLAEGCE